MKDRMMGWTNEIKRHPQKQNIIISSSNNKVGFVASVQVSLKAWYMSTSQVDKETIIVVGMRKLMAVKISVLTLKASLTDKIGITAAKDRTQRMVE